MQPRLVQSGLLHMPPPPKRQLQPSVWDACPADQHYLSRLHSAPLPPRPAARPTAAKLIALAQQPLSAWGHDGRHDAEGVLERDEPLERVPLVLQQHCAGAGLLGAGGWWGEGRSVRCVGVSAEARQHCTGRWAAWCRQGCWAVAAPGLNNGSLQRVSRISAQLLPSIGTPAVQKGPVNDIAGTALKHGELLKLPGIFAAFRELLQVGGLVLARWAAAAAANACMAATLSGAA